MQHLILGLALLFSSVVVSQSVQKTVVIEGNSIQVSVINALSDKGTVEFAFYDESGFLKNPLFSKSATIKEGQSTVVFKNIEAGKYAVVCYQDANENNRMDFYENGRPKENYGSSNNMLDFGPPQFDTSMFEVTNKDISLEIKF